jgi:uncharacterized protein YndB with AHSA1/START domain
MATPQSTQANPEFLLVVRRTFPVSRERLFAAWAERDQLEKWMCRDMRQHKVMHHVQDIRTGGRYLMEVQNTERNVRYDGGGDYLEITPPERIVFTWAWKQYPLDAPANAEPVTKQALTEVTVEFFSLGPDSSELVLTHRGFTSAKEKQEHERGWNGCFDELAKIL